MKRLTAAVAVLVALAGVSACDGGATPAPAASAGSDLPVAGADCPGMASAVQGRNVRFGVAGATNLAGIVAGTGATGIVLSHMSDGNVCQWILSFNELIGKGYTVLAYDSHGSGASDSAEVGFEQDVVAAVETLRADGATSIVLMGASLGGASSIVAATLITPPVAAVVAVSSPLAFAGVSAQEAAPRLKVPVLYVAQADDSLFGDAARQLAEASTASPDARYLVTPGTTHGNGIIDPGGDEKLRAAVADFLTDRAPPA
jgi:pimeloyl-ACP methyl ester carboxylesterase